MNAWVGTSFRFDQTETDCHATTQPASETVFASRMASEQRGIRRRGNSRFSVIQQRWFDDGRERRVDRRAGEAKDSTLSTRGHYIWGLWTLQALRIASRLRANPDTPWCILRYWMRPHRAGSELLELGVYDTGEEKLANVIFAPIHDRRGRSILSVRDQNTFAESLRMKRLMTLVHLFLVHRFKADSVHYVTPTEENQYQVAKMSAHGIFREVNTEVGQIIVADVNHQSISELLAPNREALGRLIRKER